MGKGSGDPQPLLILILILCGGVLLSGLRVAGGIPIWKIGGVFSHAGWNPLGVPECFGSMVSAGWFILPCGTNAPVVRGTPKR